MDNLFFITAQIIGFIAFLVSLIAYHRIISLQILRVPILFIITIIIGSIRYMYKK